ncbi:probable anhydro-N-acetylmuramic acid kinase [Rhynchosporium graminicola]|uniref:Probable anhydro-N-acetylmuramic acid kinase n=1 Tax=Rhynchosporium graminicola TaxID=2792576 RepID=A0A1E1LQJ4_9HELO|nr:probable anhydro-N-acetylmuramic acid kinase [Rhynchosporium commune]
MARTMNGLIPAPKGRVRTAVGHKYLEALQSKANADSDSASSPSPPAEVKGPGLSLLVLGITSGTTMHDIDFALCRFTQASPEAALCLDIVQYDSVVMPSKIRAEILSMLQEDSAPPSILSQMDAEMGHTFANAIHIFAHKNGISVDDIDLIGSGGQLITLTGSPPKGQHRSNMCLGEGAVISAKTGVTTVSDYRTAEQAVGRQGAPLFAYLLGLLLHHPTRMQICITIGGISSVCFIPPDNKGGIDAMYDWDTGPGLQMIDTAFRRFGLDPSIDHSSLLHGEICHKVIKDLLENDEYLSTRPPKTTAREIYGDAMANRIIDQCLSHGCTPADTIATLTRFTSASIAHQMLQYGPSRSAINNSDITVDGRGMFNTQLILDLQNEFPGAKFGSFEVTGVPSNAKKAVGFAMQAMECLLGRALPVPMNADVRRPNTITGKIAPGLRWREVIEKSVVFGGQGRGWEGLPEVRELIVRRKGEMDVTV